jgi:predicted methyltransferase
MKTALLFASALALAAPAAHAQKPSPAIAAALADKERPATDVERDGARKPAQMLAFAGVRPGMKVGEILPGAAITRGCWPRRWGRRAWSMCGCPPAPGRAPRGWSRS